MTNQSNNNNNNQRRRSAMMTRSWAKMIFCAFCFAFYSSGGSSNGNNGIVVFVRSFQLSMVASRFPTSPQTTVRPSPSPASGGGLTSSLISNLACMALKRRLKTQTHVSCDLSSTNLNSNALFMGRVGPVTVRGRGWGSSLGLTCRAIEATVDTCHLDVPRVLTKQKLVLSRPAEGRAMVALTAEDFGNFITHPLMKPPSPPTIGGDSTPAAADLSLKFLKDGVVVDPSDGSVSFFGTCDGKRWKFSLKKGSDTTQKAVIRASLAEDHQGEDQQSEERTQALAKALSESSTEFFNKMVFELDGTFLSFEDMGLTAKGTEPSVLLKLNILVRKFPSPGLEF
eukprot:CAMPEP_0113502990 /NCGR_PEP_ID=MMETSP0014_2-20120614/33887_1 /TAXON_ID=2857 /ORGANISM="Nitzschia sp." /LENGTH=339 /DNA_ID=CAMNT_0000397891 /DNA_START=130 /DNA_END=1149 /DNA_ORIENTATION=+ /assembly_acc=CAM_ASM_000159